MDLRTLPKTELHLHLDCSLSYDVVRTIRPSITLADYRRDFIAPARCTNLADFLTRPLHMIALMQTPEQLRLVVFDLFEQLKRDHLLYAEIRFAPLLHTEQGLTPEQVVTIVEEATEQACSESGIEARLILCTLRHYTTEQGMETVKLVERFRATRVAALDIAGDEAGFPLTAHILVYQYARERNLPRTAHAGEASGPQSVWETLKYLQPSRIGHGVRSSEDPALVAYLREQQIHLEVCPSSNLQTNMYPTYANHPLNQLYAAGLSLGISTDTRTVTDVTLTEEYERIAATFGWQRQHFLTCNLHALHASFQPADIKQLLIARLQEEYTTAAEE